MCTYSLYQSDQKKSNVKWFCPEFACSLYNEIMENNNKSCVDMNGTAFYKKIILRGDNSYFFHILSKSPSKYLNCVNFNG